MKRTYHSFVGTAAVTLGALMAVLLVSGGWQAVAAALGVFAGLVTLLSFTVLRAAADRPQPGRPARDATAAAHRVTPAPAPSPADAGRSPQPIAPPKLTSLPSASR
jgi:hypothetical protein